jgi:hypothetical protein
MFLNILKTIARWLETSFPKFNREARRSLEKELQDLSAHRDSLDITDESLDKRINDIEKELEQIYIQKAKGAQIRSREKSCSSFSKDLLASRLNFDLLLQYIIVASLISIFRTSHKSRQSTLLFTLS